MKTYTRLFFKKSDLKFIGPCLALSPRNIEEDENEIRKDDT